MGVSRTQWTQELQSNQRELNDFLRVFYVRTKPVHINLPRLERFWHMCVCVYGPILACVLCELKNAVLLVGFCLRVQLWLQMARTTGFNPQKVGGARETWSKRNPLSWPETDRSSISIAGWWFGCYFLLSHILGC